MQLDRTMIGTPLTWPLRIIIAAITAVTGLALTAGLALTLGAMQVSRGLHGQLTVEIPSDENGKPGLSAAVVEKTLNAMPGIRATLLTPEQAGELLRPWLGADHDGGTLAALPLPQLLDVQVEDSADMAQAAAVIRKKFPGATVSDHQAWLGGLSRALHRLAFIAAITAAALLAALFSTIIFACRAGLEVHRPMIELLHLIGANAGFIGREVRRYAWRLVWPGCASGLFAAVLTGTAIAYFIYQAGLAESLPLSGDFLLVTVFMIAALPALALLFAAISAWWTTRQTLLTMP